MISGVETSDLGTKRKLELVAGADWHFADAKGSVPDLSCEGAGQKGPSSIT